MNKLVLHWKSNPINYLRMLYNVQNITQKCVFCSSYSTSIDTFDTLSMDLLHRQRYKTKSSCDGAIEKIGILNTEAKNLELAEMTVEEFNAFILNLVSKNKDKVVAEFLTNCTKSRKNLPDITMKRLFRTYSIDGKPEMIEVLKKYCSIVNPCLYKRNGGFTHYLAKAQCIKGNSEKGLVILEGCYNKYEGLRSFYRIIFRELIQDSVLNRSEASLVIFKKYVLKFSKQWGDHYPLVCFWHICWSSSWFSDQVLAEELLENSVDLQHIVKDKATAFSINILKQEYNEDAVMRILQTLLKYEMMLEYVKVLQVLFIYKLKNRDLRGCSEIVRNCEALGYNLPPDQQGRYIRMLIDGKKPSELSATSKNFKLKF